MNKKQPLSVLPDVLTPQQAAEYLSVTEDQLRVWRNRSDGPAFFKVGSRVRYASYDLDQWAATDKFERTKTTPEPGQEAPTQALPRPTPSQPSMKHLPRDGSMPPGVYPYESGGKIRYRALFHDQEGRQSTRGGFTSSRAATQALAEIRGQIYAGTYLRPSAGTTRVAEIWTEYCENHLATTAAQTRATRLSTWTNWVAERWGSVQVKRVTTQAIRGWLTELRMDGTSDATIANIRKVMLPVFDLAVENRLIAANPMKGMKLRQPVYGQRRYLNRSQIEVLIGAAAPDDTWQLILAMLTCNGLRVGELVGLRVGDIDCERNRVTIARSVTVLHGELHVNPTKTRKIRTVPIFPLYRRLLVARIADKDAEDWLFPGSQPGRPLNADALARRLARHVDRIRTDQISEGVAPHELLPRVTPHELRHTAASIAVASGATILAVQRMLGHSSSKVTLNVYADLFDEDLDVLADAVTAAHRKAAAATDPELDVGRSCAPTVSRP